jgi:hypothetical protein
VTAIAQTVIAWRLAVISYGVHKWRRLAVCVENWARNYSYFVSDALICSCPVVSGPALFIVFIE